MKKVLQAAVPAVPEVAEYYCDFHPERRAYAQLKITGGYGSDIDMQTYAFDLSDNAVQEVLAFIRDRIARGRWQGETQMPIVDLEPFRSQVFLLD